MYRIVLLCSTPRIETQVDNLLNERLHRRYLLKVLPGPEEAIPLINGVAPDVLIFVLPQDVPHPEVLVSEAVAFAGHIPLLAIVEHPDEAIELSVLQAGAQNCLILDELTGRALLRSIRGAVERRKVEDKLAREEEMLGNLLAQLPDRIYFKDLESRFLRVNNAQANLFGLRDPAEAIGRTDHDFFTTEHAQPALEDERVIIRTGEPMLDKLERETLPDGTIKWVLTSKLPLRDRTGKIIGTYGISHDVTTMKVLEETIESERRRLEELSEDLRTKNLQLEQDLVMAKGIQEALLPGRHCVFPVNGEATRFRIECSSVYRPAEAVGGDFFTVIQISPTKVGILICDIMGHGLRAALGTAIMRGLVEELKSEADSPDRFLTDLNRGLRAILRNIDEPLLVTACYLVASSEDDEVLLSSAGHPLPLIIHRATHAVSPLGTRRSVHGPALALFDDATYGMERLRLAADDLVLLFTDGVTEMSDVSGREIGVERFMAAAGKYADLDARQMCEKVLDEIQLEAGGAAFEDDVCLLAIERREIDSSLQAGDHIGTGLQAG
jgi:sigma-B regulation protein RsbU (phosphoserine phosphatase)